MIHSFVQQHCAHGEAFILYFIINAGATTQIHVDAAREFAAADNVQ